MQLPVLIDVFRPALRSPGVPAIRNNRVNFEPSSYGSRLLLSMPYDTPGPFYGNVFISREALATAMDAVFVNTLPHARNETERIAVGYLLRVYANEVRFPGKAAVKLGDSLRTELRDMDFSPTASASMSLTEELRRRADAYIFNRGIVTSSSSNPGRDVVHQRMEALTTTYVPVAGTVAQGVIPRVEKLFAPDRYAYYTPVWGNVHARAGTGEKGIPLDIEPYRDQDPEGASEPIQNTLVLSSEPRGPGSPPRFVLRYRGSPQLAVGTILGVYSGRVITTSPANAKKAQTAAEQEDLTRLLNDHEIQVFRVSPENADLKLDSSRFGNELRFAVFGGPNGGDVPPGPQNADIYYLRHEKDPSKNASFVIATEVISKDDPIVIYDDEGV